MSAFNLPLGVTIKRAFAIRRSENGCKPMLGLVSYARPLKQEPLGSGRKKRMEEGENNNITSREAHGL